MPANTRNIRESVELAAFGHFLLTGRMVNVDALTEMVERKFNPNHDRLGRFASGPGGGSTVPGDGVTAPKRASMGKNPVIIAASRTIVQPSASRSSEIRLASGSLSTAGPRPSEANDPIGAIIWDRQHGSSSLPSSTPVPRTVPDANRPRPSPELGSLSAHYETGGRGVGTVSKGVGRHGKPDPGGVSYGSFQLTSQDHIYDKHRNLIIIPNGGNVARFLKADGTPWASHFEGLAPGSKAFSSTWQSVASSDGAALHTAEYTYIKRENYDKAVNRINSAVGVNFDTAPLAVRDALWSTAVQQGPGSLSAKSGGATRIFIDALNRTHAVANKTQRNYYGILLRNVYQRRAEYTPSDHIRYLDELKNALRRLYGL